MRRHQTNSLLAAQEAIAVHRLAPLEKPVCLRDCDRPFWDAIIASRARSEWCGTDVYLAAKLARTMADLEAEDSLLDSEGYVTISKSGAHKINPRLNVTSALVARMLALLRCLQLTGTTRYKKRDILKLREFESDFAATLDSLDDDLLAKP
jgi:hypothetical protein